MKGVAPEVGFRGEELSGNRLDLRGSPIGNSFRWVKSKNICSTTFAFESTIQFKSIEALHRHLFANVFDSLPGRHTLQPNQIWKQENGCSASIGTTKRIWCWITTGLQICLLDEWFKRKLCKPDVCFGRHSFSHLIFWEVPESFGKVAGWFERFPTPKGI